MPTSSLSMQPARPFRCAARAVRMVVLPIRDPEQFKRIAVGDQVEATYVEAAALSITPAATTAPAAAAATAMPLGRWMIGARVINIDPDVSSSVSGFDVENQWTGELDSDLLLHSERRGRGQHHLGETGRQLQWQRPRQPQDDAGDIHARNITSPTSDATVRPSRTSSRTSAAASTIRTSTRPTSAAIPGHLSAVTAGAARSRRASTTSFSATGSSTWTSSTSGLTMMCASTGPVRTPARLTSIRGCSALAFVIASDLPTIGAQYRMWGNRLKQRFSNSQFFHGATMPTSKKFSTCMRSAALIVVAGMLTACATESGRPASSAEADKLVSDARVTLNNFMRDPDQTWIQQNIDRAKAVLIAPQIVKAGFIFGGSGGRAVLVAKDAGTVAPHPAIAVPGSDPRSTILQPPASAFRPELKFRRRSSS